MPQYVCPTLWTELFLLMEFDWVVGVGKLWSYHTILLVPFIFSFSLLPLSFFYFLVSLSGSLCLFGSVRPSVSPFPSWECKLGQTADIAG